MGLIQLNKAEVKDALQRAQIVGLNMWGLIVFLSVLGGGFYFWGNHQYNLGQESERQVRIAIQNFYKEARQVQFESRLKNDLDKL